MNDNESRLVEVPRGLGAEIVEMVLTPDNMQQLRDERQRIVLAWCEATFGAGPAADLHERASRVVEEALELAQCEGVDPDLLHELIDHVFARKPGQPWQEAGGVGVTLLAYCERRAISAEQCERAEFARAVSVPKEKTRERQSAKAAAGIARYPE
ncbi:MAG: hypothetical protein WD871_01690 [Xanthobacteraceae bacterium]